MKQIQFLTIAVVLTISFTLHAQSNNYNSSGTTDVGLHENPLQTLQQQWAHINYEIEEEKKKDAFITLTRQAKAFLKANPNDTGLLIWQGIIQSSTAGAIGGFDALDYAKAARKSFEQAMRVDENALSGSAMTSLGVLYHKLPGWPISFGSDKKAEKLLKHALEINPNGIDSNYFYAEYLFDNGNYGLAKKYVDKAKEAPPRPSRPLADKGRLQEIAALEQRIARKN